MSETRQLTLYTRYGCHLCEDMLLLLNDFADELHIEVALVDIDNDLELKARYNDAVPVLMTGDREICRHFFNLCALKEALAVPDCR